MGRHASHVEVVNTPNTQHDTAFFSAHRDPVLLLADIQILEMQCHGKVSVSKCIHFSPLLLPLRNVILPRH